MMRQAAVFGEKGQIDDSARCLEEVERLREHRKEVDLMGDNLLAVVKHQKVSFISIRSAKYVVLFKQSMTHKKESRCISKEKFTKVF